jgi:pyruvate formate lyase activating enzyme
VEEIMTVVRKDRRYYEKSGGGLTLSGGEPLAQPEFCLALLQQAKSEGFHTCIESSGFTMPFLLANLLEAVDLYLYDVKLFDDDLHREYTGVSNELILANLEWLVQKRAAIVLRCAIIPQINDTDDHFRRIAGLVQAFPSIQGVEVMPFHNFGRSKTADIGMIWKMEQPSVDEEQSSRWIARLRAMGCGNVRKG